MSGHGGITEIINFLLNSSLVILWPRKPAVHEVYRSFKGLVGSVKSPHKTDTTNTIFLVEKSFSDSKLLVNIIVYHYY